MHTETDQKWSRSKIRSGIISSDCSIRALYSFLPQIYEDDVFCAGDLQATMVYPRAIDSIDLAISTAHLQLLFYIDS